MSGMGALLLKLCHARRSALQHKCLCSHAVHPAASCKEKLRVSTLTASVLWVDEACRSRSFSFCCTIDSHCTCSHSLLSGLQPGMSHCTFRPIGVAQTADVHRKAKLQLASAAHSIYAPEEAALVRAEQ